MTFRPAPLYMAVQYALAEMRLGRKWAGSWYFTTRGGFVFRT